MQIFTNPFIWLYRVRHRKGYGVHSPFAFRVVNEVVYEKCPYYAFSSADEALPFSWRFRRKKALHMLFRLANLMQPRVVTCPQDMVYIADYIRLACPHAEIQDEGEEADMVILPHPDVPLPFVREGGVAVVMDLKANRQKLQELGAMLTMDLYDMGLAFWNKTLTPIHYKINF